jgi:HSP20 family protein
LRFQISDIQNKFESISIKKNNLGNYVLYGLIWWEFNQDNVKTKALCSVKSDNLIWKPDIHYEQNSDYTYVRNGHGAVLYSFLTSMTRKVLYNFTFENIFNQDVLVELTILNGKKDEYMTYNIYESVDNYLVKINVAGVKKEEIKIILEDGIVKVKTNPKLEENEEMETLLENFKPVKSECEIYLPNIESVQAKVEDGVLILTAPKISKGIKIEIE